MTKTIGDLYLGGAKQSFFGVVHELSMVDHEDALLPKGQVMVTLLVDLNDEQNA